MSGFQLTYKRFGARAILIEWPAKIDENIQKDVHCFRNIIIKYNIKQIIEVIATYNSLTIIYDVTIEEINSEIFNLKQLYSEGKSLQNRTTKLWHVPVCYDPEFAMDLKSFSKEKNLSVEAIITLHSKPNYLISFIGFLPGFLYLSKLDSSLEMPRKQTPNLNIKKGSVAIGGMQTGIYPIDSPGGWYVIGNSPLNFFDVSKKEPCFAQPGDYIKFFAISKLMHHKIHAEIQQGNYHLEVETYHG